MDVNGRDRLPPSGGSLRGFTSKHTALKKYIHCKENQQHPGEDNYNYVCSKTGATHQNLKNSYKAFGEEAGTLKVTQNQLREESPGLTAPVAGLSGGPAPQGP